MRPCVAALESQLKWLDYEDLVTVLDSNYEDRWRFFVSKRDTDTSNIGPSPNLGPMKGTPPMGPLSRVYGIFRPCYITIGLVCYVRLNLCNFLVKSIMQFLFMR